MMLRCPNNPNHDMFVMTVMVPEIWTLNRDGDCEEAEEDERGAMESDLTTARCQDCDALVEIVNEDE